MPRSRLVATLFTSLLFTGGGALVTVEAVEATTVRHVQVTHRTDGCAQWLSIYAAGGWAHGSGMTVCRHSGVFVALLEDTHCCGWKVESQTHMKPGGAGTTNASRARCWLGEARRWWRVYVETPNGDTSHEDRLLGCLR